MIHVKISFQGVNYFFTPAAIVLKLIKTHKKLPSIDSLMHTPDIKIEIKTMTSQMILNSKPCFGSLIFLIPWMEVVEQNSSKSFFNNLNM